MKWLVNQQLPGWVTNKECFITSQSNIPVFINKWIILTRLALIKYAPATSNSVRNLTTSLWNLRRRHPRNLHVFSLIYLCRPVDIFQILQYMFHNTIRMWPEQTGVFFILLHIKHFFEIYKYKNKPFAMLSYCHPFIQDIQRVLYMANYINLNINDIKWTFDQYSTLLTSPDKYNDMADQNVGHDEYQVFI